MTERLQKSHIQDQEELLSVRTRNRIFRYVPLGLLIGLSLPEGDLSKVLVGGGSMLMVFAFSEKRAERQLQKQVNKRAKRTLWHIVACDEMHQEAVISAWKAVEQTIEDSRVNYFLHITPPELLLHCATSNRVYEQAMPDLATRAGILDYFAQHVLIKLDQTIGREETSDLLQRIEAWHIRFPRAHHAEILTSTYKRLLKLSTVNSEEKR